MTYHIKNREKLLSDIAWYIKNIDPDAKIGSICVTLFDNGIRVFEADLMTALRYVIEDIYWDQQGDWSNADDAQVRII